MTALYFQRRRYDFDMLPVTQSFNKDINILKPTKTFLSDNSENFKDIKKGTGAAIPWYNREFKGKNVRKPLDIKGIREIKKIKKIQKTPEEQKTGGGKYYDETDELKDDLLPSEILKYRLMREIK